MTKLARNGLYRRVPSDAAWAVIDDLRKRGWSGQAIATAANLPRYTVERAITADEQGDRRELSPRTSLAIVTHGDPVSGGVGAYAARRRLQGLARQGYDLQAIADATGIGFSTLAEIRRREHAEFVRARFHIAIRDYAESVGIDVGPSPAARLHAERKGWPALLAWNNVDDPNEQPDTGTDHRSRDDIDEAVVLRVMAGDRLPMTIAERREVVRRLTAAGWSEKRIEAHTGITKIHRVRRAS